MTQRLGSIHRACIIPLGTYHSFQYSVVMASLECVTSGSLHLYLFLVPFLGFFSFHLFVVSYSNMLVFVLYYHITFIIIPEKPVCFLMRDRKGENLNGRGDRKELEGEEGRETKIRIYYVRKKSIFNTRGKEKENAHEAWIKKKKSHTLFDDCNSDLAGTRRISVKPCDSSPTILCWKFNSEERLTLCLNSLHYSK